MKTSPSFVPRRQTAGVALVLVLSILILLTAIVVAFFTNATTDLVASKNYSDSVKVKLLGSSTVNLVEGQIRAATQGGTSAAPLAWASQPGLIRTYDNTGYQQTVYKLYSSDTLQVKKDDPTAPFNPNTALATEVPTDWNLHPSDFVDLNSPSVIVDPTGTIKDPNNPSSTVTYSARFPIIDGNNLIQLGGTSVYDGIVPASGSSPGTKDGVPDIEGFSVQSPSTYKPGNLIAPNNNPVPMPVRWLYVLQDGSLQPRINQVILGASKTNPVVSRVAFWTDDDTCKLNINVASEGNFWDRPRGKNNTEVAYSLNIPAQNEFQMFPGHPAKNCLSTVLGAIWPVPSSVMAGTSDSIPYVIPSFLTLGTYNKLLPYYDLAPRVTEGKTNGSAGGTQNTDPTKTTRTPTGVAYDGDRLYTSVDEMMFQPKMANDNVTRLARNDVANTAGAPQPLTTQYLETSRFFLTASNRAPEVTLLNTPRVMLWQLQANPASRTAKDKLLAFCSTLPTNSTNLFAFQRLSDIPGGGPVGSVMSSDSPNKEFDRSTPSGTRNIALYAYLQRLLRSEVPGLGGNFSTKYTQAGADQILTEMLDLSRSTVNIFGATSPGPIYDYSHWGQVVPLQNPANTSTQGFGRFATISEAALDFFRCNDPDAKDTSINSNPPLLNLPMRLGAMMLFQPFSPAPGFSSVSFNMQYRVTGLQNFYIKQNGDTSRSTEQRLGFPGGQLVNIMDSTTGGVTKGNCAEYNGLFSSFYYNHDAASAKAFAYTGSTPNSYYPFFNTVKQGDKVDKSPGPGNLPYNTTNFDFYGHDSADPLKDAPVTINVEIWSNPESPTIAPVKIQTLSMQFPPCYNLPVPKWPNTYPNPNVNPPVPPGVTGGADTVLSARQSSASDANTTSNSINDNIEYDNKFGMFNVNDVVRSVVVDSSKMSKGDYRVMATMPTVPTSYFTMHPFYYIANAGSSPTTVPAALDPVSTQNNWRFADSIREGNNQGFGGFGYYTYGNTSPWLLGNGWVNQRKSSYNGTLIALPDAATPYYSPEAAPSVPPNTGYSNSASGFKATGVQLTGRDNQLYPGDWDTGAGAIEDGPYINKPDEGYALQANGNQFAVAYNATSVYYSRNGAFRDTGSTYSPNRQVSSAVMYGSLPTGTDQAGTGTPKPWQTLLFCANPAAGINHPGFGVSVTPTGAGGIPAPPYKIDGVPDHYVLDLFDMPIVEPYAISEPLSSQGKVNMNYQIAPFTYIKRDTAVRAVLKGTRLTAIPSSPSALTNYKALRPATMTTQYRYPINPHEKDGTLKFFEDRFAAGDLFRSASEICSVPLVPSDDPGQTYDPTASAKGVTANPSSLQGFWNNCKLTGDNLREEPYGDLYPRLTTKSNTFTVHVRVQTLKKAPSTAANTFVDPAEPAGGAKDVVTAEYRGSYQIERYVDPNPNPALLFPDYADPKTTTPLSAFYKFHTIGTKQF